MRRVLLDITRIYRRRLHQHDTGIDRVERAYLTRLETDPNAFVLIRVGWFVFIFSASRADKILQLKAAESASAIREYQNLANFERSGMKRHGLNECRGYQYINVGHTYHPDWFFRKLFKLNISIKSMIHDVLPLDYPEFTREDQISAFQRKFDLLTKYSQVVLTPSEYSKRRIDHFSAQNFEVRVCPLASKLKIPNLKVENAWLMLGTIEPRKNHLMMLNIWEHLISEGCEPPDLWIVGARGWRNEGVFNFLDNSRLMGSRIYEIGACDDEEMKSYFARAKGLLFPSFCEGFGLPLLEALKNQKPYLASDIPPFREITGQDGKELIDPNDFDTWAKRVLEEPENVIDLPNEYSWPKHFECALT